MYFLGSDGTTTYTGNDAIFKVNLDGTGLTRLANGVAVPQGMALDIAHNRVFVSSFSPATSNTANGIYVIDLSTGAPTLILSTNNTNRVMEIAYDEINDYLYYISIDGNGATNVPEDALNRIKSDGSNNTRLAASISPAPSFISLDIKNNKVYVYESLNKAQKFLTFTLNGNAATLTTTKSDIPAFKGMYFDDVNNWLYYTTDNGSTALTSDDALFRMHPDGTAVNKIVDNLSPNPNFIAIDRVRNVAFVWNSTAGDRYISKVNIATGDKGKFTPKNSSGTDMPFSISYQAAAFTIPTPSNVATLSALSLNTGTISPAFASGTTSYTASVGYSTASITVLPTKTDGFATIKVNDTTEVSGQASRSIKLNFGENVLKTLVTAEDGLTTKTYTITLTRPKFVQTITFASLPGKTYGDADFDPGATINTSLSISYSSSNTDVATIVNKKIHIVGPGTADITASQPGDAGNAAVSVTQTLTVNKAPQTITFAALPAKTYGDGNFTPAASTTSGLTITWASSNTGVATVDANGNISIKGAGTASITVSQAGNNTYLAAANVSQTITVNKAVLTYTANTATKVYGTVNPAASGSIAGFVYSENQASATTGTMSFSSPATAASPTGTYAINGSGLSAANYSFAQASTNSTALIVTKATLSYAATAANRAYGAANPTFNGTVTGFLNSDTQANATTGTLAFNTTATVTSAVGSYPVNGSGLTATNYDFVQAAPNSTALTVGKTALTFTANAATRTYGAANPTFTGTITGFVNSEGASSLTGTPVYSTTATATTPVGSYPITLSGVTSDKYTFTAAAANSTALTITKATLQYVATPVSNARNTAIPAVSGTVTGFLNGDSQGAATSGALTFATDVTSSSTVGTYPITGSGLTAANYNIEQAPGNNTAFTVFNSDNGFLSSLTLSTGSLSGGFSSSINNYTAEVSTGTTSITVTPTLSDLNAKVTVNGTEQPSGTASAPIALLIGENTIQVNVTAQNGTTSNPYTIVVTRLPSQNADLANFSVTGRTLEPTAYADNYEIHVDKDVTSFELNATLSDPNASMSVSGTPVAGTTTSVTKPLKVGENPHNVVVRAQDGTTYKGYSVKVIRAASTNNQLTSLSVAEGSIGAFDNNTHAYSVTIDNAVESVNVTGEVADTTAYLVIDGYGVPKGTSVNLPIRIGTETINVRAVAQSGAVNTFTIAVTRPPSTDASLSGIDFPSNRLDQPFSSTQYAYVDTIGGNVTSYRLRPFTTHSGATVKINGSDIDGYGSLLITPQYYSSPETQTITVTAQDGITTQTYTVKVYREFNNNAKLETLSYVNSFQFDQPFDPGLNNYTTTIDSVAPTVTFHLKTQTINTEVRVNYGAVLTEASSQFGDNRTVSIHGGVNIIPISVFSYGGTTNIYTVTINRKFSSNAKLGSMSVSGTGYNTNFSGTFSDLDSVLTANIPYTTTAIRLVPNAADPGGAVIHVNGVLVPHDTATDLLPLEVGLNEITITVTSGDSTATRTYNLHANRLPFADVTLSSLTVGNGTITPALSPSVTSYTATVGSSDTQVTITPVATAAASHIDVNGDVVDADSLSSVRPIAFSGQTFNINVVAPDGVTKKIYRLKVNVPVPNAELSSLTLSKGTLSPAFLRTTDTYTATVPYTTSSIDVTPRSPESGAVIRVNGTLVDATHLSAPVNLNTGLNTITVLVTNQDTIVKTYTVNLTRSLPATDATLANLQLNTGITETFAPDVTSYTATVPSEQDTVQLTTLATDTNATIKVNGNTPAGGKTMLPLLIGENTITTIVKAQDTNVTNTYTLKVTRLAPSAIATLDDIILGEGTLNATFDKDVTDYSATVSTSSEFISILPLPTDFGAAIKLNGTAPDAVTGAADLPLVIGNNTITITVKSQDSTTTKTYTLIVTRTGSSNALLSALDLEGILKAKVSGVNYRDYTATTSASTVKLTATAQDPLATITVNGTPLTGTTTPALNLDMGTNTFNTVVTATDGTTTNSYSIVVTRKPPNNALLNTLVFNPAVTKQTVTGSHYRDYIATVPNATRSITVAATLQDPLATLKINGTNATSGIATAPITLNAGPNTINTTVTAQDGTTINVYSIVITRLPSGDATLAGLNINPGVVKAKATGSNYRDYTATVANTTKEVTVTAIRNNPEATIKVNNVTVTSGTASPPITLTVGANTITTTVTAGDGSTKTYSVVITRPASGNNNLKSVALSPGFTVSKTSAQAYQATVNSTTDSIRVKPTLEDAEATVTINGQARVFAYSTQITLHTGDNPI
ncbi:MAG: cadherin-like beta sandwich domain-containing protein, partial [Mucilaginibacter sp.]